MNNTPMAAKDGPTLALVADHAAEDVRQRRADGEDRDHLDKVDERVGFSNGCAELALKKPPPLVPSILIASCEATGPTAIVCFAPSSVVAST